MVISSNPADINECLTLGLCKDSDCVNTRGSYLCTCRPGLMLDPSRSRCVCECCQGAEVGDTGRQSGTLRVRGPGPEQKFPPSPIPGPSVSYSPWNWAQCTKMDLSLPAGTQTAATSLGALGISFGTLQFGIFYYFFSSRFCPICGLIYLGGCVLPLL